MEQLRRIAIGSDHAGYEAKERAKRELEAMGFEVVDKGAHSLESVDYPDFGAEVGRAVSKGEVERGVLICGSGIGISMAANKIAGVRAALCWNEETPTFSASAHASSRPRWPLRWSASS
jgi:ribose 5-phosphate isomerase B